MAEANARLSFRERLCFGAGDFVGNMLFGISGSYLIYFYTTIERIPAASVALLMLVARIFDSLADPAVGLMIDRQTLFGGRLRPYIKWFAFPFVLSTFLCFVPLPVGGGVRLAWAYGTYLLCGITFSLVINPYGVLPNVMTDRPADRLSLATFRMFGAMLGISLVGATALPAVHLLGHGDDERGFVRFMALVCAIGGVLLMAPYFGCRERLPLQREHHRLRTALVGLLRNRAWVIATIVLSTFYLNLTAFYGLALYYAQAVLGMPAEFGGVLIAGMGFGKMVGTLCSPALTRRVGPRAAIALPYLASIAGLVAFLGIGRHPAALLACFATVCFFEGLTLPVMYMLVADSIDFGARELGLKAAGLAYSINNFVGKVAWAIGGALSAGILAWGGYDPAAAQQTLLARHFIIFGFLGVPLIVALASAAIVTLYPSSRS
ncbi:Na+/melibiose symporter [Gluconacetobacter sacchari DSM 12717]|uniref:MFS transporter n=2 Tax=Gluconacetobacter sacchari TaxID=92759 RepID=A0A7W4NPV0_9PROT|nr:glycoside-pentoside-hexuronide (GPH):cation symporter [Gluconacetobacter sacchari]MBB2161954.1 hypothetical protein [Gluconacetobacter sacchari]GBQ23779.1 Na+/melibiose symporter [Gluconacetobacter sacchari DSM 12717]